MKDEEMADMKDEEMAVNWIRSQGWNEENLPSDEFREMLQAYLAGLKAGRDMVKTDLNTVAYMQGAIQQKNKSRELLSKARDLILKLYNAGRDVLMCREEEKAYDNLSEAINDRSIERFLKEIEQMTEKEIESKAIETCQSKLDIPTYAQGFVNGAEFGYNKANDLHSCKNNQRVRRSNMKYNNGDKVKVISGDGVYSTYLDWISKNAVSIQKSLPHWVYGREMDDYDLTEEWTVIYSGAHLEDKEDTIVFIDNGEKSFMIDENYLVSVSKDDSNCDAVNILKQLVSLIEGNKELLEKAKKILESL